MKCRSCGAENVESAIACTQCASPLRTPTQRTHVDSNEQQPPRPGIETRRGSEGDAEARRGFERRTTPLRPSLAPSSRTESGHGEGEGEEEEAAFKEGDVVLGVYVIERQLGRGGMGAVYLGRDDVSGQRVAIKVLPGSLAKERDIRERFIQEARALAALDHPGIVPLITFAQDGDDRFLVMKYVAGRPLEKVLNDAAVMSPGDARRILKEVAQALHYAHGKGVVHRDIKPANVLIDENGRVVVVDFGIARKLEGQKRLTQTGMLMGTPQYMSPEQIGGLPVDGRADLYACGLLLFEMLTGRPPFDAEKTFDILKAHVEQPVPDARALRAARDPRASFIPDDLLALTHALLEKEPKKRPQTGQDVVDALEGRTAFSLPPSTDAGDVAAASSSSAKPRATSETPAMAFSDSRDDDEALEVPSNPARKWAALFVVGACGLGALLLTHPEWLEAQAEIVVDAGNADDTFQTAALLSRARMHLDKNKLDDARVAVDTALHLAPGDVEALLLRARILAVGNNHPAATETLAKLPATLTAEQEKQKHVIEQLMRPAPRLDDETEKPKKQPPKKKPPKKKAPAPSPSAPAADEGPPRPSELDDEVFLKITRSTKAKASACYVEHVLSVDNTAEGEVSFSVVVSSSGAVRDVTIKKNPFQGFDGFASCLKELVMTWSFPAFSGDDDSFVHKLYFRPG